jgi:hypothetical protein
MNGFSGLCLPHCFAPTTQILLAHLVIATFALQRRTAHGGSGVCGRRISHMVGIGPSAD